MMLELKERLKGIYGRFDVYITSVLKFLSALIAISLVNSELGYMDRLNNISIVLIVALLCTFLPKGGMVFACAGIVVAHFYMISLELAAFTLVLFIIMFCLYIRFEAGDSYIILLVPILFWIKLPYFVPLLVGLIGGIASFVPIILGLIAYFLLSYVSINAPSLSNSTMENMVEKVRLIIDGLLNNKEMILMMAAFSITAILVQVIRRLSVNYSWAIAIGVGSVVNMIILLVGALRMEVTTSVGGVIGGNLAAAAILFVLQYFIFSVDYSRTEHVQFEDDDYVYYVKAVPKMTVTTSKVNVKKINTQKVSKSANK